MSCYQAQEYLTANSETSSVATTRGDHSHRCCSHSCDQGQKILTIVFVAWPLDRTHLTTLCNTHAQNVNIFTAFENCPRLLDRHQKQPLTLDTAVTMAPMGMTTPCCESGNQIPFGGPIKGSRDQGDLQTTKINRSRLSGCSLTFEPWKSSDQEP